MADKAGTVEEIVELPENSTISDLLEKLTTSRSGRIVEILREVIKGSSDIIILHNSKTPVNGLYTELRNGDIVVFIPPISGGS